MKTVYLGMSGGVDSSVSAVLLKEQGYRVVGVYMKNWSTDLPGMKCPWAEDLADAKRVAVQLDLDFEVWDFEKQYKQKVVDYMLDESKKGNTPNPDIMCNQEIKFKLFYEEAMKRGADFIATGHYARVCKTENVYCEAVSQVATENEAAAAREDGPAERRASQKTFSDSSLCLAADINKDQTYFLYRISQDAINHTIFPLGDMLKPDVKKLAAKHGLANAYKKESMGVCFVGEVGMKDFLRQYIDIKPGEIREQETGQLLGHHEGAVFYTIGQRHGLYIGGGLPYYIVAKDLANNILYVSKNLNHPALWTNKLELRDIVLRTSKGPAEARRSAGPSSRAAAASFSPAGCETASAEPLLVRLRHRAPLIPCTFQNDTLIFAEPIKRPASGQSAVLYSDNICLGGGIIK